MNESVSATATTCAYCGVGCGIQARPGGDNRSATVQGLADHPANFGRLCSKGSALGETLGQDDRLLHPVVDGLQVSWDTALDTLARRFRETLDTWGPDSVAVYLSGQLLTEDYYVANKLMKGFIGSANVDTNSRLCMSSSVSGHVRAFGSDTVPNCYEDLELADLVILTGSNLAWCHPVLFQRLRDARARRPEMKIVVIDPRRTDTCDLADLHLALRPGTDGWLFTGLLAWLGRQGALDYAWLEAHTEGFGPAIRQAQQLCPDLQSIAEPTGLSAADISRFFSWFVTRERTLTLYSQGIHQTSSGTDKVNAIINCHLATGRIGKPGSGLLSLTGQPNAMGGREVGGLATQLAAHLPFTGRAVEAVREFWQAPAVVTGPGKTATKIFDAMHRGEIRAIWIMGTNPAVSLPDGNRVREALARCPLVVVSEVSARADTLNYAHIRLPAAAWGEKNGTVTNSERRISRQRPFLPLPGEAKPDWWMLTEVARRLGFAKAFDYRHPADIFREHAALSGWRNTPDDLPRTFNISALADIRVAQYDALTPIQWPVTESAPCGTARLFGEGGFPTASGKARMLTIEPRGPARPPTPEYPFALLTGRIRDQWHTMTRTALAPRLNQHEPEPVLSLHPLDARELALEPGHLVRVCSEQGEAVLRVRPDDRMHRGQVFAPMHWSAELAPFSRINTVIPTIVDPVSKQPEYKHTPVRLEPVKAAAWLTLVSVSRPAQPENALYQAHVRLAAGWHATSALSCPPADLSPQWLVSLISETDESGTMEWLEYHDAAHQVHRYAALREGRLVLVAYLSPEAPEDSPGWLHDALSEAQLDTLQRMSLLAGRPLNGGAGQGRTVCACFGVGEQRILALREDGVTQVEEICQRTQAGTNCGSCLPEIRRLLR